MTAAAVLAIAMYACQGFVGYPLTAVMLKMEGRKLLSGIPQRHQVAAAGEIDEEIGNIKVEEEPKRRLIPPMPEKYTTTAFILGKMAISAYIASLLGSLTGLNQAVWA